MCFCVRVYARERAAKTPPDDVTEKFRRTTSRSGRTWKSRERRGDPIAAKCRAERSSFSLFFPLFPLFFSLRSSLSSFSRSSIAFCDFFFLTLFLRLQSAKRNSVLRSLDTAIRILYDALSVLPAITLGAAIDRTYLSISPFFFFLS